MTKKKRVVLSAGGTGGHLFPAQAVAQSLLDSEILFVAGGLDRNHFFDRSQFSYQEICCATFSFSKPLQLILASKAIMKGLRQSRRIIRSFCPDVIVGFGSFYTLPVLLAALLYKIPIILHEQNSIAGKVNRFFSHFAHTTAITFSESATQMSGKTCQVSFPTRMQKSEDPWSYFGLEKGRSILLVFGGSQGAQRLNELFLQTLPFLSDYQVLHFTGYKGAGEVQKHYRRFGNPHVVKPFEPKLHLAMQIADLAITRAGAGTIAELVEQQTPAILIPFPYATDNHQEKNAQYFVGGEVYREKTLTAEKLLHAITHFPIEKKKSRILAYKQNRSLIPFSELIEQI